MVAAEAMSYGTPVLVPNLGGIQEVVNLNGHRGGLLFDAWNTTDLATQLEKLLKDDALHAELARNARPISENFSVANMTDRVLAHMGLPTRPGA
jgi:glycosyltransferase involved in cell wall biosynthesis